MQNIEHKILLITLLLFMGCNNSSNEVEGYYEIDTYNLKDKIVFGLLNGYSFAYGSTLQVNKDSTFEYTTCANIMNGKWHIDEDSIVLNVVNNRWKIDSLNTNCSDNIYNDIAFGIIKFKTEKSAIHNIYKVDVDGEKELMVEKLYKVK